MLAAQLTRFAKCVQKEGCGYEIFITNFNGLCDHITLYAP